MIDFTPPFKRISMLDGLKEAIGLELPGGATNMGSPETNQYLLDMCAKHEVICTPPTTTARLLDKLVGEFLESQVRARFSTARHACCLERVCPRR